MSSSEASLSSTLQRLPPPATLGVISICVVVYFLQVVLSLDLQTFTMCPRLVLYTHEYYRMLTSTVFHVNLMHIGMNMLSMSAIGTALEKRMGTLRLMLSIWWAMLLTSSLYVLLSWLAYVLFRYDQLLYSHAAGFSGVLFHLSVLEAYLHSSSSSSRSLFGVVSVPLPLYPWALLIVLQFIMPHISFLGHLAGILTGNLQYWGLLDHCCLLGETFLMDLERRPFLRPLVSMPTFIATSQGSSGQYTVRSTEGGDALGSTRAVCSTIQNVVGAIVKVLGDVLETIRICIFGRGSRINANIRIWDRPLQNDTSQSSDRGGGGIQLGSDNPHSMQRIDQQEQESLISRIV